jgi:glucose/arabinose dehydrogenase
MKALAFALFLGLASPISIQSSTANELKSNDYFVHVTEVQLASPSQENEGSLTLTKDHILVVRRLGQSIFLDRKLTPLHNWKNSLELNLEVFQQRRFGERGLEGVKGVLFDEKTNTLFVSLVRVTNECASLELFSYEVSFPQNSFRSKDMIWKLPVCVPLKNLDVDFPEITPWNRQGQPNISQAGGRMAMLKNGTLLLSVGNFGDSWLSRKQLLSNAQSGSSFFGKVISFSRGRGVPKVFSSGHRNIQGLIALNNGNVMATEHGPEGGDEINLLQSGNFYGWPYSSEGNPYSNELGVFTPLPKIEPASKLTFTAPIWSWIPSIAPTQMIEVRKTLAPNWRGDLIVGTLRDQSLRRVRLKDNSVILDERIPVGFRVRDMIQYGKYLFLLDDAGNVKRLHFITRKNKA